MDFPVGARSPATLALPSAAFRVRAARRRLYTDTWPLRPYRASVTRLAPKVGAMSTWLPAST